MALLTAATFKESREAEQAGVTEVADSAITAAIAEAEATLYSILGYNIEYTPTTLTVRSASGPVLRLPQRARTVSALTEDGTTIATDEFFISASGFELRRYSNYLWYANLPMVLTGTFGFTSTEKQWVLAVKWVRVATADYLRMSSQNFVTGYDLDGEPSAGVLQGPLLDPSGRHDLKRIVTQIGLHPSRRPNRLHSVPMRQNR